MGDGGDDGVDLGGCVRWQGDGVLGDPAGLPDRDLAGHDPGPEPGEAVLGLQGGAEELAAAGDDSPTAVANSVIANSETVGAPYPATSRGRSPNSTFAS